MDFQGQSERKRVCAPEQTLRYERSAYDCTRKVGADAPSRVAPQECELLSQRNARDRFFVLAAKKPSP